MLTAARALAAARQGRWGPGLDLVDRLRNRDAVPQDYDTAWLFEQLAVEARRYDQPELAAWLGGRADAAPARST